MIGNRREEDQADIWLRENDPYYTDKRSNKKRSINNPYETPEQEHRRAQVEIPFTALSMSQMLEVGMDVKSDDEKYSGSL